MGNPDLLNITGVTLEREAILREITAWPGVPSMARPIHVNLGPGFAPQAGATGFSMDSNFIPRVPDVGSIFLHEYGHTWEKQWLSIEDRQKIIDDNDMPYGWYGGEYMVRPVERFAGTFAQVTMASAGYSIGSAFASIVPPENGWSAFFKERSIPKEHVMFVVPFDFDQNQWGSRTRYPDRTKLPWQVDKTVLHWGGRTNPGDPSLSFDEQVAYEMSILRGWQRYHIDSKGWTDIAYSFAAGNSGMRYRLRGENRAGATSGDYDGDGIPENSEARALVWIGGLGYTPTDAAYGAMGTMVDPNLLVTVHSDHKATLCPGDNWVEWRDQQGWTKDGPVTPVPSGGYKMRVVRDGMGSNKNPDPTVAMAQRGMTIHGFRDRNTIDKTCGADGVARSGTEQQIKDFQQAKRLVIDGVVGDITWAEIDKEPK